MQGVVIRLLPDGSGRVCTHWFYEDPEGPLQTLDHVIDTSAGPKLWRGRRWRCACQPQMANFGDMSNGRLAPVVHTDEPRAATCPKCLETEKYQAAMAHLASIVATSQGV